MFYFRSPLFKGGVKNDAKLEINFETCKSFRRFFKLFSKTRSGKASGSAAPFTLPAASVTPSGALAAVAAGPPSQKRVQSYTLLLKLPNFLPRNFSRTMFFSTFFHITPLTDPLQRTKCRSRDHPRKYQKQGNLAPTIFYPSCIFANFACRFFQ